MGKPASAGRGNLLNTSVRDFAENLLDIMKAVLGCNMHLGAAYFTSINSVLALAQYKFCFLELPIFRKKCSNIKIDGK